MKVSDKVRGIYMPVSEWAVVREAASSSGLSINAWVRRAIRHGAEYQFALEAEMKDAERRGDTFA